MDKLTIKQAAAVKAAIRTVEVVPLTRSATPAEIIQIVDNAVAVQVMQLLIENEPLPATLQDHPLRRNMKPFRDLHIQQDWLLIYYITGDEHVHLDRTGTQVDIFG